MPRKHPSRNFGLSLLIVGGAISVALTGCGQPPTVDTPPRAVKVMQVAPSGVTEQSEYAAEIRPRIESRLGFRVAGKITARRVELGQAVKPGQVLATLDAQDYRLSAEASQAALNSAKVNLELAQSDYRRFKDLFDQNFISRADLDRRDTTLKAAQAQFEQAKASAAVQTNQTQYATLVADVAGVVTSIDAQPGQVVNAGTPVVTIAQSGPRDAVFAVPEDRIERFRMAAGAGVQVKLWGGEGKVFPARIREVAAAADPATRTYLVKADIGIANVAVGQSGTVIVGSAGSPGATPTAMALKVPMNAVFEQGGKSRVWVLDTQAMVVKAAEVKVVGADGSNVVLAGGIVPGQTVVAAGTHVLSEGQKVSVYQPPKGSVNGGAATETANKGAGK
jgi:membrane fusion protein, multidrug efflux system